MRTELVLDALSMAVGARGGAAAGVIAHADRGSQHTSNEYLDFCAARQLRPSVGKTGICWDTAVVESFWESLKRECLQGGAFATRAEARRAIFRWINWYNSSRLHTSLGGVPPVEWEQQYRQLHNPLSGRRGDAQSAVRAILANPRYTGYQVWNKQRRDEILLDVNDVAAGYETKLRWNDPDDWVWSTQPAHPPSSPLTPGNRRNVTSTSARPVKANAVTGPPPAPTSCAA